MAVATDPSQALVAQDQPTINWYTSKYGGSATDPNSAASLAFARDRGYRTHLKPISAAPAGATTLPGVPTGDPGWSGLPGNQNPNAAPVITPNLPSGTPSLAGVGAAGPQTPNVPIVTGEPVVLFDGQQGTALSDFAVDTRAYNAVHVDVIVTGSTPSATVSLLGGISFGATFVTLGSPLAVVSGITQNKSWDLICGAAFLKAQVSAVSGSFSGNQGFRVIVTPYLSPGPDVLEPPYLTYQRISAASNNAGTIKSGAGRIKGWMIGNTSAAFRYVKFYDESTVPAPAADTVKFVVSIPPTAAANVSGMNIDFETGIGIAMVTGIANNDNTAVAASDLSVSVFYY